MEEKKHEDTIAGITAGMTPEAFCRYIWQQYLVERRYDIFQQVVDSDISVIGTGGHEISRNLEQLADAMRRESTEWNGRFLIKDQWCQTTRLSDDLAFVFGEMTVREDSESGILYDMRSRFTMVVRKRTDGWKVVHVHQSVPDPNQAQDEFFPHRMLEQSGQQIIYHLRHDSMTGLLNRLYLRETINRYMRTQPQGLLLMLDIDDFKSINDNYGHPFGDKVLILFSQCLKTSFPQDTVGRVGGDEFVVYLSGAQQGAQARKRLNAFLADWQEQQKPLSFPSPITVSIGAAQCPQDGDCYDTVWNKADEALYLAKKQGKNNISLYEI